MRESWSSLQQSAQDYTRDTNSSSLTFLKKEMNLAQRFIYAELAEFISQRTQTTTTVANQQFYHYPPDMNNIESVYVTIGNVKYVLEAVDSQTYWNLRNAVIFSGTALPRFFFPRRDDFGIWPIPQTDGYTITVDYTYRLKDLSNDDYTTGTVTVTNNSTVLTGSGTTFTNGMIGRWVKTTNDGYPYRLQTFTSTTIMGLESAFQGTTASAQGYTLFESPEIPPELHELIPYRAAALYFGGYRKDPGMAKYWNNMFWTGDPVNDSRDMTEAVGGLLGAKKRYSSRSNSAIIRRRIRPVNSANERRWAYSISGS